MKDYIKNHLVSFSLIVSVLAAMIITLGSPTDKPQNFKEFFAGWNSNVDIINILEITNSSQGSAIVNIEFYQNSGVATENQKILLAPGQQQDVILNNLKTFKKNSYGIVKVKTQAENVSGRLSYYRAGSKADTFEFGFSAPLRKPINGSSNVPFNTFNPSGQSTIVSNWLSILNISDQEQKFSVAKRTIQGTLVSAPQEIILAPFARYDYEAGHVAPGKDAVGLVSITPTNPAAKYLANLTRYGLKEDNSGFNFAFQIQANSSTGKILHVPVKNRIDTSSFPLQNWLEIGNTDKITQTVKVEFYDEQGLLIDSLSETLLPYSQIHLNASKILGSRKFGSAKVSGTTKNIIAQSMYYVLKLDSSGVSQVFGSEGKASNFISQTPTLSWNRFIGMDNFMTVVNPDSIKQKFNMQVNSTTGESISQTIELPGYGSTIIPLNSKEMGTNSDGYGSIILEGKLLTEVVRIKKSPDGKTTFFANQTTDSLSETFAPANNNENPTPNDDESGEDTDVTDPINPNVPTKDIVISDNDMKILKEAAAKVRATGSASPFSLQGIAEEGITGVELVPHEIRGSNYNENMRDKGKDYTNPEDLVSFFKSTSESSSNFLRLTLIENPSGAKISGILSRNGVRYSIKPHLLDLKGKRLMLTEVDLEQVGAQNFECHEAHANDENIVLLQSSKTSPTAAKDIRLQDTSKIVEVAIDADYEKFLKHGSISATNAAILATMNEVDAVYKNLLNISIRVVTQNVWSAAGDPYTSTVDETRLQQFKDYAYQNIRPRTYYDYANLFTGLDFSGSLGIAYVGAMCKNSAAGMTSPQRPNFLLQGTEVRTIVHEIGHSLGSEHDNCSNTDAFIMCGATGVRNGALRFSPGSLATFAQSIPKQTCLNYAGRGSAPIMNPFGNHTVTVGSTLTLSPSGSDPDGDPIYRVQKTMPAGSYFDAQGYFKWIPTASQIGVHTVEIGIQDLLGNTVYQQSRVTVVAVVTNRPPVLSDIGTKSVNTGNNLTFTVTATDPDNDPVTITATNLPAGASFSSNRFSWTPSASQTGQFSVSFRAVDSKGASDTKSGTIVVSNGNRNPVFNSIGNISTVANRQLVIPFIASDPDGDPVFFSYSPAITGASLGNRNFIWTPTTGQVGNYDVTFTARDSRGGSTPQNVRITVTLPANNAPYLTPVGSKTVTANSNLSFVLVGSDPDGDPLTYSVSPVPVGASIIGNRFSWTPSINQVGNINLTFAANDGRGGTSSNTSTVTVNPAQNRPPVFDRIGDRTLYLNRDNIFTVNAQDPDFDYLTYSVINAPPGATFNNKTFSIRPTAIGTYYATFRVNDPRGGSATEVVKLTITDAPAGSAWKNPINALDVNNDSIVSALDALIIINTLNQLGARELVGTPNFANGDFYYDVTGDGNVSALDVLQIINYLNSR